MNAAEKIAHAAERKAFETMLDSLIRKSQTKDVCTVERLCQHGPKNPLQRLDAGDL